MRQISDSVWISSRGRGVLSVVPQMVAKIAIGNYSMGSDDCEVVSIAKVAKVGGV